MLQSFVKIKPLRSGQITLPFTDVGKPCPNREFKTWQICLLTISAKIKFSRKYSILQYEADELKNGDFFLLFIQRKILCCALLKHPIETVPMNTHT